MTAFEILTTVISQVLRVAVRR